MNDESRAQQQRFSFRGGALPLDYCNTVDWHSSPDPKDRLHRYEDVVDWSVAAGAITSEEGDAIREEASKSPDAATAAYREAIEFREAIFRLFSSFVHGEAPDDGDIKVLNEAWSRTQANLEIRYEDGQFRSALRPREPNGPVDFRRPTDPVVRAAVDLFLSPKLKDVRRCEGPPGCGWLFLDHTKNHSRRWCSMQDCGNRAKMRRFQERKKDKRNADG